VKQQRREIGIFYATDLSQRQESEVSDLGFLSDTKPTYIHTTELGDGRWAMG
jgi:hypothetical protein